MGSSASLDRPELAVEPGQQVSAQLRVRNNGSVVDQFTFEGLGAGAAWIETEPEVLSLFPGAEGAVTVHFRPPRSPNTAPGPTPFGVKVISAEDPTGSAVEEGVITVGRFADRSVELYPLTARGRRRGRFEVAVDNRGNAPIEVEFSGADPENACRYEFAQQALIVEPGTAHFTKFDVIPHERFWKGPPKTHQFQVLVSERARSAELPAPQMAGAPGAPPVPAVPVAAAIPEAVNGTLLQEAMLPPWLIKAVLAILALILLLWILWITLFKPTVQSAAKDAVAAPLASLNDKVDALTPTTAGGGGGGGGGGATTTTVAGGGGGGGGATTTTTVAGGGTPTDTTTTTTSAFATQFGNPTDFQLGFGTVVAPPGSQDFPHPITTTFALTDIILQNPNGDTGTVLIKRDGNTLMQSALENFRDLDLHFVAPFMFNPGSSLTMTVTCTTPGPPNPAGCVVSGSFGGFQK